jgi:glycosyltransferase involved in cell wall biosynthesis
MALFSNQEIAAIPFKGKDYVLVLPGWYPHVLDKYTGDFNQRHVLAASQYTKQVVVYIGKDPGFTLEKTKATITQVNDNLVELIVLYPQHRIKFVDVFLSNIRFLSLLFSIVKQLFRILGKPKLLHAYIVIRGGLAAALVGWKYALPFVLSENWTIYYHTDKGFIKKRNIIFRWTVQQVFKRVKLFLPVTQNLADRVTDLYGNIPSVVIPNVVDTSIFNTSNRQFSPTTFTFLHASTMWYQKNPEALLRAFKQLTITHPNVQLLLAGPAPDEVKAYATSLFGESKQIQFLGNLSYEAVATLMKQCHALVLFSRYENLPCIILESLCSGLPVISTQVGGIDEVIHPTNGLLLANEDEAALLQAMKSMIDNYHQYQSEAIATNALQLFSYEAVGKQLAQVYAGLK